MRTPHLIGSLRRWRRGIAAATLPAFCWWTLSASACFGMPLGGGTDHHEAAALHEHAAVSSEHGSAHGSHDHAQPPACPHCPPAADETPPTTPLCVTEGAPNASGSGSPAAPDVAKHFTHVRLSALPRVGAGPPLLRSIQYRAPPQPHTPLNIRHCVFLI